MTRNANKNSLFRIDSCLSSLTTIADLARILFREASGESGLGMHTAYRLASMHLDLASSIESERKKEIDDLMEFVLVAGNTFYRINDTSISAYLAAKAEMRQLAETGSGEGAVKARDRFRSLLEEVIVGEPLSRQGSVLYPTEKERRGNHLLIESASEIARLYSMAITGDALQQRNKANENACTGNGSNNADDDSALKHIPIPLRLIPNEYLSAAGVILSHFHLLPRLEIASYDDIVAGIRLESYLAKLPEHQSRQIQGAIDKRLWLIQQSILKYTQDNPEAEPMESYELRKSINLLPRLSPKDLLYETRVGYFLHHGIEMGFPRLSLKHVNNSDYFAALLSGVAGLSAHVETFRERNREKEIEMELLIYIHSYNSRAAYVMNSRSMRKHHNEDNAYSSQREKQKECAKIAGIADSRLTNGEIDALRLVLMSSVGNEKCNVDNWGTEFSSIWPGISQHDALAWLMLAGSARLRPISCPVHTEEDKRSLYAIGISGLEIADTLERELMKGRAFNYQRRGGPKNPGIWKEEDTVFFPLQDFWQLTHSMLAVYVQKQILRSAEPSDALSQLYWRSPVCFTESYTPADMRIARALFDRYPLFREHIVRAPIDIPNGIALAFLQRLTGDANTDSSATITQNLIVRQMHALNKLIEGTLERPYDAATGRSAQ